MGGGTYPQTSTVHVTCNVPITAQADSDCHVTLSPTVGTSHTEKFYEVVIGGWNDERSVIRQAVSDGKLRQLTREVAATLDINDMVLV